MKAGINIYIKIFLTLILLCKKYPKKNYSPCYLNLHFLYNKGKAKDTDYIKATCKELEKYTPDSLIGIIGEHVGFFDSKLKDGRSKIEQTSETKKYPVLFYK